MKSIKTIVAGIATGILLISAISVSVAAYGNDNSYGYNFDTKAYQQHSYSGTSYYRGTADVTTPWKVNFTYSSEGEGTIMQYFLAGTGSKPDKVSDYKEVKQGAGEKYFRAYDSSLQRDTQLGARNNNYTVYKYSIAGYWDEETAYHQFSDGQ